MKSQFNPATIAAFVLMLPAAYVIILSVLKYGLGVAVPFDASAPLLERWGTKEALGWNIILLILFAPMIAFTIAFIQIVHVRRDVLKEKFMFQVAVSKNMVPILLASFSLLLKIIFLFI